MRLKAHHSVALPLEHSRQIWVQVGCKFESPGQLAQEAGVSDKVVLQHGDAGQSAGPFAGELFDVVLCHNVLEYVECQVQFLSATARLMRRDSPALLPILVRNRAGEMLKAALQAGDLEAAERGLTSNWGYESLYGGQVRLFTPDDMLAMSKEAGLEIIGERGVRVIADYLPPQISRKAEYQRIFEAERKLGQRLEFAAVARYTHYLARCANHLMEHVA